MLENSDPSTDLTPPPVTLNAPVVESSVVPATSEPVAEQPVPTVVVPPTAIDSSKKPMPMAVGMVIAVLLLLAVVGVAAYQLGTKQTSKNTQVPIVYASPSPQTSVLANSATPSAKPTLEPEANATNDWTTYTNPGLPGTLKLPPSTYTTVVPGSYNNNQAFHLFITTTPLTLPETWDSPLAPMEILAFPSDTTTQNYDKAVETIKGLYTPETLTVKPVTAGNRSGVVISGTTVDGYLGGQKISYAVYKTATGYVQATYFPTVDKNFTVDNFLQILSTLKLN